MGLFDKFGGPPKPEKFAKQFADQLKKCGSNEEFVFEPEEFRLKGSEGQVFNLGNFYQEYCGLEKSDRADYLKQIVIACLSSHQDLPDEYEHAKPDLRVKLWSRAAIEKIGLEQRLQGEGKAIDVAIDNVGEHLYASVVYDLPSSIRSISREEIDEWDVSEYVALEDARHNLMEDGFAFASIGESVYCSMTGDSYDASRILLIDLIRQMAVDGDYIAMVPNRDSLLFTGSNDDDGLEIMLDLADEALEGPRPILPMPLRLDGDAWVDWMPPKTHPLSNRFEMMALRYFITEYDEQKQLLEAIYEEDLVDVFVASFNGVQRDDDSVFSYGVWSKGINTSLPKTDMIMFFEEGKEIVCEAEWDRVVEVVGDLMQPDDLYPPRFRVESFPTDAQLAQMK